MKQDRLLAWLCLLPAALLVGGVIFYPILNAFLMALSQVSRAGDRQGFAGLAHFAHLFRDPIFWQVFSQTVVWTGSCVSITLLLSLVMAVLLDADLPGRRLWRAITLLPWAGSMVPTAAIVSLQIATSASSDGPPVPSTTVPPFTTTSKGAASSTPAHAGRAAATAVAAES